MHRAIIIIAAVLLPLARAKLPYDALTDRMSHDCWVPDYCDPAHFYYKLCKLRLRGRAVTFKLKWDTMPMSGSLHLADVPRGSFELRLPPKYV